MAQSSARPAASAARRKLGKPFLGLIDAVVVDAPADFAFDGAITTDDATAAWTWMVRDLAPDLIDIEAIDDIPNNVAALDALMPDLLSRARNVLSEAQSFGRAANSMGDEAALALALQSMPLQDHAVASLLMTAAVGQVATPTRLINAAIRIANSNTEPALTRAGFGPLIDACFAHAQDQIPAMSQSGTFSDMDLVCRAVDRFHRLLRAVTGYVELNRSGRWSVIAAALTKAASERIEPKLRNVGPDMNMALRKREGNDRVDGDQILAALNGIYLLATVRDSRDSLAVNALFDQVWAQTGQALEIHLERNLEALRRNPADSVISARLDAALKMAEVRFNLDYAETMRRAKDVAERRA